MATGSGLPSSYQRFINNTYNRPQRFSWQSLRALLKTRFFAHARSYRREGAGRSGEATNHRVTRSDQKQLSVQQRLTFANVAARDAEADLPNVAPAEGDEMSLLKCPRDGSAMYEVARDEVLIDVCPKCRGVWLDRGELEKLMERVYLPDDANIYERKQPDKRKRPSLQDFFN